MIIRLKQFLLLGIALLPVPPAAVRAADSSAAIAERLAKYPVQLQEPLRYGRDLVEVTADNTLRRRYRVWGDWDLELRAYLDEARDNAQARGTPGRRVKMGCIFLKDARITCSRIDGADGRPLTGTFTTPPEFVEAM